MNAARCGFVAAILLAGQPFVPAGFPALAAGGRALNAGTTYGAFDLDPREGAVDVSAGPAGTHLLIWREDSRSVRTVPASGDPTEVPPLGPFSGWTAAAIADGPDGRSRVLWVAADGRMSLEIVGPEGTEAAFRFGAQPSLASAADLSVGAAGEAHVLWTNSDGSTYLSRVDAAGVQDLGPEYGPYASWKAVAVADGTQGSTWVLWRSPDGRSSLSIHRGLEMEAAVRFDASPGWTAEDLTVGADGRPRLLRVHPDGRAEVTTIDSGGRLSSAQIHANPGFSPRRIAAGPDGLTRLLWGDSGDLDDLWLLNPDNARFSSPPPPPPPTPTPTPDPIPMINLGGTWRGTFQHGDSDQIVVAVVHDGSEVRGHFETDLDYGYGEETWSFRTSLTYRSGGGAFLSGHLYKDNQQVDFLQGSATSTSIDLYGGRRRISLRRTGTQPQAIEGGKP